jgi:anti-sigma B factor antagonist
MQALEPAPDLMVDVSAASMAAWVQVVGDLDIATVARLATVLTEMRLAGHVAVTLDLSGLDFIGAAGLNTLVAADNDLRRHGGGLRAVAPRPYARSLFAMTGLSHLLDPSAAEPVEDAGV